MLNPIPGDGTSVPSERMVKPARPVSSSYRPLILLEPTNSGCPRWMHGSASIYTTGPISPLHHPLVRYFLHTSTPLRKQLLLSHLQVTPIYQRQVLHGCRAPTGSKKNGVADPTSVTAISSNISLFSHVWCIYSFLSCAAKLDDTYTVELPNVHELEPHDAITELAWGISLSGQWQGF
ncbi:hypothetical protein BJX66DRAFT_111130 [Aspergillus keveii]|uniref:Uncharacterized protein n=1 Tax=Aspergillus keveii TaxID=714993 RepID=A0ABR4FL90_9EURO